MLVRSSTKRPYPVTRLLERMKAANGSEIEKSIDNEVPETLSLPHLARNLKREQKRLGTWPRSSFCHTNAASLWIFPSRSQLS
jgi:hypothetical protein